MPVFWPGKVLTPTEEGAIRGLPVNMRKEFEKFLPENVHDWTPDQLEGGAHIGPWSDITADLED